MGPSCHCHVGAGCFQVSKLGDIARYPREALTHLTRHLLTGRPDGEPLSHSLGVTGRPAVIISASSILPPAYIGVLTTCGSRFSGRGVKSALHCLLVWGCWPAPGKWKWLADGWCHLRSLRHHSLPAQSSP